jgi:hypothetical protein
MNDAAGSSIQSGSRQAISVDVELKAHARLRGAVVGRRSRIARSAESIRPVIFDAGPRQYHVEGVATGRSKHGFIRRHAEQSVGCCCSM